MSKKHNVVYEPPPDRILFGQFLIEKGKITEEQRDKALEIQAKEGSKTLRESHRLLGTILLQDFNVFNNRMELHKYLQEFIRFKEELERMRFEARISSGREE